PCAWGISITPRQCKGSYCKRVIVRRSKIESSLSAGGHLETSRSYPIAYEFCRLCTGASWFRVPTELDFRRRRRRIRVRSGYSCDYLLAFSTGEHLPSGIRQRQPPCRANASSLTGSGSRSQNSRAFTVQSISPL